MTGFRDVTETNGVHPCDVTEVNLIHSACLTDRSSYTVCVTGAPHEVTDRAHGEKKRPSN